VRYTDYAAETIRTLCLTTQELRKRWANAENRDEIIQALAERGISFDELAEQAEQLEVTGILALMSPPALLDAFSSIRGAYWSFWPP
jgi:hypothetical protein